MDAETTEAAKFVAEIMAMKPKPEKYKMTRDRYRRISAELQWWIPTVELEAKELQTIHGVEIEIVG